MHKVNKYYNQVRIHFLMYFKIKKPKDASAASFGVLKIKNPVDLPNFFMKYIKQYFQKVRPFDWWKKIG